jgi:hypothetical protein
LSYLDAFSANPAIGEDVRASKQDAQPSWHRDGRISDEQAVPGQAMRSENRAALG